MQTDDYYRIPAIMQDCKTAYNVTWRGEGSWSGYTYTRKGTIPNINGIITFKATLKIARKPKYFLGIKIHRAILQISWELTTVYSDTHVVEVITLDPGTSDKEKTKVDPIWGHFPQFLDHEIMIPNGPGILSFAIFLGQWPCHELLGQ